MFLETRFLLKWLGTPPRQLRRTRETVQLLPSSKFPDLALINPVIKVPCYRMFVGCYVHRRNVSIGKNFVFLEWNISMKTFRYFEDTFGSDLLAAHSRLFNVSSTAISGIAYHINICLLIAFAKT